MINVAVIEDHQVLVDALQLLMRIEPDLKFVGAANTAREGERLVQRLAPDVLLLDIGLPDGDGLDLIKGIKAKSPHTQIVVLTCLTNEATLMRAIDLGVSGFISKSGPLTELLAAIHQAAQGEIVMPTSLLLGLLKRVPRSRGVNFNQEDSWEQLTPREREILYFLAKGKTGTSIANELHIAPLTVRTHIRNLMSKLGVHSRLEAVTFGLRNGLIDSTSM